MQGDPERDRRDALDAFLRQYRVDLAQGDVRSLREYLRLFPGAPREITRSYVEREAPEFADAGSLSLPPDADQIDLFGPYRIQRELGRGGQGVVYKAEDTRLKRTVALKVLKDLGPDSADLLERFKREAKVAARLEHPGICGVHDTGVINGTPYMAMKFVEGQSLKDRIAAAASSEDASEVTTLVERPRGADALPDDAALHHAAGHESLATTCPSDRPGLVRTVQLVEKMARALHAAHEAGVIHRDIKPGNIMITPDNEPVLLDFGMARAEDLDVLTLTRTGDLFGTPAYMSPEQISASRIRLDRRTDIYSLGVTLYECLTSRRPFEAATREKLYHKILVSQPPDPRHLNPLVSKDLKAVLDVALDKDREKRYQSAAALADDLRRIARNEPILAKPPGAMAKTWMWSRRNPALAGSLVCILVTVAIALTLIIQSKNDLIRSQDRAIRLGLLATFEAELKQCDWSEEAIAHMDEVVAGMQGRAPNEAQVARQRLELGLAQAVRSWLRSPRVRREDVARIEQALRTLDERTPETVPELRKLLKNRLSQFELSLSLEHPFAGLTDSMNRGDLKADPRGKILLPTSTGPSRKTGVVITRAECRGNVQLEAVFSPDTWPAIERTGLLLHHDPQKTGSGYHFLVTAPARSAVGKKGATSTSVALGTAVKSSGALRLQISRNLVVLCEREVPGPKGPLRLLATREGDRLVFQVGEADPLVFQDVIPLEDSGHRVFGILWPEGLGLTRLQARHQPPASELSALERADALFARGKYREALDSYGDQIRVAGKTEEGQEARCKQALCLKQLRRRQDAAALFEQVAQGGGKRWPIVAACELALIHLKRKKLEEALAAIAALSRFTPEEIAELVPEDVCGQMRNILLETTSGASIPLLQKADPKRLEYLQRAEEFENHLHSAWHQKIWTKSRLLQGYAALGADGHVERILHELMADERLRNQRDMLWIMQEKVWLAVRTKKPQPVLPVLDRAIAGGKEHWRIGLLVSRARIHAALGDWDMAQVDLENFLGRFTDRAPLGTSQKKFADFLLDQRLDAHLMFGFVQERLGNTTEAVSLWREAYVRGHRPGRMASLVMSILGSLSGAMTEENIVAMIEESAGTWSSGFPLATLLRRKSSLGDEFRAGIKNLWRSERGRDYARRIAFRDITPLDSLSVQLPLGAIEAFKQGAFLPNPTKDQEALLWELSSTVMQAHRAGKTGWSLYLRFILSVWPKKTFKSFEKFAPGLVSAARGPLAYVLGHRARGSEMPDDALRFFRYALSQAREGSLLHRLARAEIGQ